MGKSLVSCFFWLTVYMHCKKFHITFSNQLFITWSVLLVPFSSQSVCHHLCSHISNSTAGLFHHWLVSKLINNIHAGSNFASYFCRQVRSVWLVNHALPKLAAIKTTAWLFMKNANKATNQPGPVWQWKRGFFFLSKSQLTYTDKAISIRYNKRIQSGRIFKPFMRNEYVIKEAHWN